MSCVEETPKGASSKEPELAAQAGDDLRSQAAGLMENVFGRCCSVPEESHVR